MWPQTQILNMCIPNLLAYMYCIHMKIVLYHYEESSPPTCTSWQYILQSTATAIVLMRGGGIPMHESGRELPWY